jgi:hypothetical protein
MNFQPRFSKLLKCSTKYMQNNLNIPHEPNKQPTMKLELIHAVTRLFFNHEQSLSSNIDDHKLHKKEMQLC